MIISGQALREEKIVMFTHATDNGMKIDGFIHGFNKEF
jgi:hypothetical protein